MSVKTEYVGVLRRLLRQCDSAMLQAYIGKLVYEHAATTEDLGVAIGLLLEEETHAVRHFWCGAMCRCGHENTSPHAGGLRLN